MTSEGFETAQFINRFIGITEKARRNIYITQVMPNPWEAHTDFLKTFHNLSHKYYPEYSLNYYRMEGYVNAMVLAKAIELTGKTLSRERLVDTLRGMERQKLADGLVINYGEDDNEGLEKVFITTITNGIFDSAN
jgi:ABC-type branched-subunit amino acid transport system substrate-binding protein